MTKSPTPNGDELICAPIQVIIKVQSDEEEEEEEEEEVEEIVKKKKKKKKSKANDDKKIQMLTLSFGEALRLINKQKVILFVLQNVYCI